MQIRICVADARDLCRLPFSALSENDAFVSLDKFHSIVCSSAVGDGSHLFTFRIGKQRERGRPNAFCPRTRRCVRAPDQVEISYCLHNSFHSHRYAMQHTPAATHCRRVFEPVVPAIVNVGVCFLLPQWHSPDSKQELRPNAIRSFWCLCPMLTQSGPCCLFSILEKGESFEYGTIRQSSAAHIT